MYSILQQHGANVLARRLAELVSAKTVLCSQAMLAVSRVNRIYCINVTAAMHMLSTVKFQFISSEF